MFILCFFILSAKVLFFFEIHHILQINIEKIYFIGKSVLFVRVRIGKNVQKTKKWCKK